MIKDSGKRTEFETGAVRDIHSGKGRMDLLPWEALVEVSKHCEEGALKYGERNCEKGIPVHSLIDSAFRHLAKYLMGMDDEPHLRAACWNCLFALYMEIKHPELQDIPARMKIQASEPCCRCVHRERFEDEFPCDECVHKRHGTDDMFYPVDCKEDGGDADA